MSVHYKFKSTLDFDTVSFDGLHISVADLKKAIFHQKRIGKNTEFDLQITNAQTKEDYTDDNTLIAKNTSLIVARVPLTVPQKRTWDRSEAPAFGNSKEESNLGRSVDLTRLDGSEDDKIRAMMSQSTQDYDPSNYMKIRGANQTGDVPQNYRCYKCHQPGHWIKNCPLGSNSEPIEIKKSTGIPRSFMVPVEGPLVPGAMMTPTGHYAVPAIDHQAYKEGKKERPPFSQDPEPAIEKPEIPENLLCTICKDLLTDAVMIPCCGNSFCDECIRDVLLDSEEHECPDCNEKDVSPDSMIPNRYLRNAVANFKNKTGYAKRQTYKPPPIPKIVPVIQAEPIAVEKPPTVLPVSAMIQANSAAAKTKSAPPAEPPKPIVEEVSKKEVEKSTSTFDADSPIRYDKTTMSTPAIPESTSESDLQSDSVTKLTTDEETEVPPPPGTEPSLLPKRPLDSEKDSFNNESRHRDDEHKDRERHQRERRRSFSRDHRDSRMNYHGNRMDGNMRGNRRRSLSPRNSQPDYQMHGNNQHQKNYQGHQPDGRYHQPPMHYDPNMRRSTDDRAGTPTVDEPHLHGPPPPPASVGQPPLLPFPPGEDRVPPPNYNQPPHPAPMPPHNPPLLPDPYMPPHRMNIYPPHQQSGHYGPPPRFDRPPYQQSGYRPNHPPRNYNGPRPMRGMHNRYRGIQPPPPGMGRNMHNGNQGVIDDPLEAFERMLREKDERDRRMGKHRRRTRSRTRSRSYSRSRSRSFTRRASPPRERASRSRSPPPSKRRPSRTPPQHRARSRTPKRRSRSGSFSISRSRSFSRSQSPRGSLPRDRERDRDRNRDGPPARYKSPARSPGRFQRDRERERERPRSRETYNTYYNEATAQEYPQYRERDRDSTRTDRSRYSSRNQAQQHNIPPLMPSILGPPGAAHPQPIATMGHLPQDRKDYYDSYNRYSGPQGQRFNSPMGNTGHKRFDDVAPPGTEGYYDLPPPGVDHPERPSREDRPRSGKDDSKDSIKDAHRTDDRGHDRERREKDERERGPSTKDHDRSRDKEDRERRDKDKEDRHTRERRDEERATERRDGDKYKEDRDRHRGEEKSRTRERRERDYETDGKRHSDRHTDERKKSKRSPSPYSSKYRETREATPPERPKKKEKDHEEKESEKKKEKKIKDKKKKKDSDEKEKKKKKKKEKKAIIQKEAAAAAAAAAALVANVVIKQEPPDVKEKPDFEVSKELIARVASSIKTEPQEKPVKEQKKSSPKRVATPVVEVTSSESSQIAESKEPVESPNHVECAEPGANPPNPNFKPIPELRPEIEDEAKVEAVPNDKEEVTVAPKQDPVEKPEVIESLYDGLDEAESKVPEDSSQTQAEEGEIEDDDDEEKIDGDTPSSPKVDEFLAPVPELSKWEREDNPDRDDAPELTERELPSSEDVKANKVVTTEVLKRAEKAIFQKAINAIIRPPIEIKKISDSRKGLYQNPEPKILEPEENRKSVNVTINVGKNERNVEITEPPKKSKSERNKFKVEARASPTRLSAKDRLGEKIDDLRADPVPIKFTDRREAAKVESTTTTRSPKIKDRRISLTIEDNSPPITNSERKVFIDDRKRIERPRDRSLTSLRADSRISEREFRKLDRGRTPPPLASFKAELSRLNNLKRKEEEEKEERRRKTREEKKRKKEHRSRSKSKDRKKRKDKKHKKDKEKSLERKPKHSREPKEKAEEGKVFEISDSTETWRKQRKNPRLVTDRKRSLLVDESNFEPDYSATDSDTDDDAKVVPTKKAKIDADVVITEEPKRKKIKISSSEDEDSSSSESSSSDTESSMESHRKKKKKHKKRKKRKSTKKESSTDSDVYTDSSDSSSEEEKHRKKSKKSKSKSKQKKKKKSKHK